MAKSKRITAVRFQSGEVYEYRAMWNDQIADGSCTALYGKEGEAALHEYRRQKLLELIPVKSTLTVVCTHRTRNGTARFRVFIPCVSAETGKPYIRELTSQIAEFVGFATKDGDISMGGWGYSKSFQIGYSLGCALWPNGTPEPHGTRNGEPDSAGGYAISVA